jgi:hypothetical protein
MIEWMTLAGGMTVSPPRSFWLRTVTGAASCATVAAAFTNRASKSAPPGRATINVPVSSR